MTKKKAAKPTAADNKKIAVALGALEKGNPDHWIEDQKTGQLRPSAKFINNQVKGKQFTVADIMAVWAAEVAAGRSVNPNADAPVIPGGAAVKTGGQDDNGQGSDSPDQGVDTSLDELPADPPISKDATEAPVGTDAPGGEKAQESTTGQESAQNTPSKDEETAPEPDKTDKTPDLVVVESDTAGNGGAGSEQTETPETVVAKAGHGMAFGARRFRD